MTRNEHMRPEDAGVAGRHVRPILSVRNVCKFFPVTSRGFFQRQIGTVRAVDHVSFDIMPGETLGLVGESGCGKTTIARTILRALKPTSGEVFFSPPPSVTSRQSSVSSKQLSVNSQEHWPLNLATLSESRLKPLRTRMQMIFQDPFSSLNPRMTVGAIVGEPLAIHKLARGSELKGRVAEMLKMVGLEPGHASRYPHAFSGGQRQRIGIARALIMRPHLIIADEPVSALDVSVQAQVINLLGDIQQQFELSYMFVAHDLSVVKHICDRIAVMYVGKIVELAVTEDIFYAPKHPYTSALLSAVPNPDPDIPMSFELSGEVADPANLPPGCVFHPRCPYAEPRCRAEVPVLRDFEAGHSASCHFADKLTLAGISS